MTKWIDVLDKKPKKSGHYLTHNDMWDVPQVRFYNKQAIEFYEDNNEIFPAEFWAEYGPLPKVTINK